MLASLLQDFMIELANEEAYAELVPGTRIIVLLSCVGSASAMCLSR